MPVLPPTAFRDSTGYDPKTGRTNETITYIPSETSPTGVLIMKGPARGTTEESEA